MPNNRDTEGAQDFLAGSLGGRHDFPSLIIHSEKMREIMRRVAKVAPTNLPILIHGETGTGKEHTAYEVHSGSKRNSHTYHAVNCACIPKDLLESELFGHERGAFTGATGPKRGILELADGGTLFLDEIGDFPLELQPKILRVMDQGRFWRVGGQRELTVNVRIVAAMNQDLRELIAEKRFRLDLYHRLSGVTLTIPPLRERPEDVLLLAHHFLRTMEITNGVSAASVKISYEAEQCLISYLWPGNVRELKFAIERAFWLRDTETIMPADLDLPLERTPAGGRIRRDGSLKEVEKEHIINVLTQGHGNKSEACATLGISPRTLFNRLTEYHLNGRFNWWRSRQ